MKKRILLVEDEIQLAKGLRLNFELEGCDVEWAATGAQGRCAQERALQKIPPACAMHCVHQGSPLNP